LLWRLKVRQRYDASLCQTKNRTHMERNDSQESQRALARLVTAGGRSRTTLRWDCATHDIRIGHVRYGHTSINSSYYALE
jgi:hypothetical protein